MANGFRIDDALSSPGAAPLREIQLVASTQYQPGDMVNVVAGVATHVAAAGKGTHIFMSLITPANRVQQATKNLSTTVGEKGLFAPVAGGQIVVRSKLTGNSAPPINGTACNSNSTTTVALVTAAGSTGDYNNGMIFIPEIGEQRLITDDTVGGGVHTFTVAPAFRRAPTTGDTAIVVPFSAGVNGVKFSSTNPQEGIGTAVADKSGGNNRIVDVDLKNLEVLSVCPDAE